MNETSPIHISDYLREIGRQPFVYIPNPGNGGDSLIAAGTFQEFERLGLRYSIAQRGDFDPSGAVLVYAGGGNMVNGTSHSVRFIAKHHRRAKKFVVLPHTIKEVDSLIDEFGDNVDLICREQVSYDYVVSRNTKANVFLADDMAFSLDVNDLLSDHRHGTPPSLLGYVIDRYWRRRRVPTWRAMGRAQNIASIVKQSKAVAGNYKLSCFRTDGERKGESPFAPNNIDLPLVLQFGTKNPAVAFFGAYHILKFLRDFDEIHTDRLHMAIGAGLLGKSVQFHANNYYKCREVYRFSMENRFPNVIWRG